MAEINPKEFEPVYCEHCGNKSFEVSCDIPETGHTEIILQCTECGKTIRLTSRIVKEDK